MEVYCKTELVVSKRNGMEEEFDPEKIVRGLQKAIRSDSASDRKIEIIMQNILRTIRDRYSPKISSENIGLIVMEELKQIDPIAYLRFASVYKNFHETNEFEQECKNLEQPSDQVI
jgi:transcriptional repressor NrdR